MSWPNRYRLPERIGERACGIKSTSSEMSDNIVGILYDEVQCGITEHLVSILLKINPKGASDRLRRGRPAELADVLDLVCTGSANASGPLAHGPTKLRDNHILTSALFKLISTRVIYNRH